MYIPRHIDASLLRSIDASPVGIILAGIVGSGKTTSIEHLCEDLKTREFQIVKFDGDDVKFRTTVAQNSRCIVDKIREEGLRKPFLFVDEIQKTPETFDAIKIAYDELRVPFVVSGSNPAYLRHEASDRLQRRATIRTMFPLSLSEILVEQKLLDHQGSSWFLDLLCKVDKIEDSLFRQHGPIEDIQGLVKQFFIKGGIPQAHLAPTLDQSFEFIKMVAERGITHTYQGTIAVDDEVRQELARQNSREFSYQGCHQRLRSSKRHIVDRVIEHLLANGYLLKKRPYLDEYEGQKSSYFTTYSWVDPGLVGYYTGTISPDLQDLGFRLESYVHCQVMRTLESLPLKSSVYYYKPFSIKPSNGALYFKQGEIDFVVKIGARLVPIEVKLTRHLHEVDSSALEDYVRAKRLPFGVVAYGGAPTIDRTKKIVYFPFWMI